MCLGKKVLVRELTYQKTCYGGVKNTHYLLDKSFAMR